MRYKIFLILLSISFVLSAACSQNKNLPLISQVSTILSPTPSSLVEPTSSSIEILTSPTRSVTTTATFTLLPTKTSTPIPTSPLPSSTMGPTYTTEERNAQLLKLLKTNGDCELPCYWGFTPGVTKWDDVNRWISYMGRSIFEISLENYNLYEVEYQDWEDVIMIPLVFYVEDGVMVSIMTQILVNHDSSHLEQFKQLYSLRSFLIKFGVPSRVWVALITGEVEYPTTTILELWLFYDHRGFVIQNYVRVERVETNYRACPNKSLGQTNYPLQIGFLLQSPNNNRPLEQLYTLWGADISGYFPVNEAISLDVEDFYDFIINGGENACFSTPRNIWP